MKRIRWLMFFMGVVVLLAACEKTPDPIKPGSFDTSRFGEATFK